MQSPIFEEPVNLLKEEVREPAIYTAIITAIATGSSRMSEICYKVGEETNTVSTYIKNLVALGIIRKESYPCFSMLTMSLRCVILTGILQISKNADKRHIIAL